MQRKPKIALIYDFDKTLSPKDMQAYGYIDKLGVSENKFWDKCEEFCKKNKADSILGYMYVMVDEYKKQNINLTKQTLVDCGKNIELYNGVKTWFDRINGYAKSVGVNVEHYIVSSGIKEMIEGTEIAKYFKEIYAGYFVYNENNQPVWPAIAINYTNKTQYIYRINKGILNVNDNSVNDHMDHDIRPIPMTNMIYIGDSATDIPCMRLIMKSGGYAIGVYKEGEKSEQYLSHLINENRINFTAKTDYSKNSELEKIIKEIISTIKHKDNLKQLTRKCKTK